MNQQLSEYIRKAREQGMADEEIKKNLVGTGWQESAGNEAMGAPMAPVAPGAIPPPSAGSATLKTASTIFKEAWQVYKARFGTFVGITILPFIFLAPFSIISSMTEKGGAEKIPGQLGILTIVSFVLLIIGIILEIFSQIAILVAVKDRGEGIGVGEAYKRARGKFWSYLFVSILTALVVMGGYALLIIPGVIFSFQLVFAQYVLVGEGNKGISALQKSKAYTKGHLGNIFLRLLVLGLLMGAVIYIPLLILVFALGMLKVPGAVIGILPNLLVVLVMPYAAAYLYLTYESFRGAHGPVLQPLPGRGKTIGFAILGGVAIPLLIIAFMFLIAIAFVGFGGAQQKTSEASREAKRETDLFQLNTALELYWNENQSYPADINQLSPKYLPTIPVSEDTTYTYSIVDKDESYELCQQYKAQAPKCKAPTEFPPPAPVPDFNSLQKY